jgi:hypothetical protein
MVGVKSLSKASPNSQQRNEDVMEGRTELDGPKEVPVKVAAIRRQWII